MREANTLLTDLLLLDRAGGDPLHRQLYRQIRSFILDGTLAPGAPLPSSRQLARESGLSRNTVTNAYDQLLAEGLTESRRGSGTHTIDITGSRPGARPRILTKKPPAAGRVAQLAASTRSESFFGGDALLPGFPDPREFPSKLWNRLANRANRELGRLMPELDLYSGYAPLRLVLAQYLRLARGVRVDPEQIFITAGASQSLQLITRALTDVGDTVWLEDPVYSVAKLSLQMADLNIEPASVDSYGPLPPRNPGHPPKLIYLTTSYQFPLGITMPMSRRLEWLDIAERNNAWLVEDDYDGEFRYQGDPIPALAGLMDNERTLYMGTFSKVLSPTLRMSYLVVPPSAVDAVRRIYPMLGNESSVVTQAVLAELIGSGHFAKHFKRMRSLYGERREAMEQALSQYAGLKETGLKMTPGGLHIPVGVEGKDMAIFPELIAAGLGCVPLSGYYLTAPAEQGFLLGFTSREPEVIDRAVRRFAEILNERGESIHILLSS
jgi:GntR family transcriptional regulator/MocR family aminotransferase